MDTQAKDIFGFAVKPEGSGDGGDFIPVLKYDAKAGRFFRMERENSGNGFENVPIDIPADEIKFVADFDNMEVGPILFAAGQAPDFRLVPIGQTPPPAPSPQHKDGVRLLVKLAPSCGGDRPVRELAGNSKAFKTSVAMIYAEYLADKANHKGMLPVLGVTKIMPVKTGTGQRSSTNYHPVYKIEKWVKRPEDLIAMPRGNTASVAPQAAAPSTGGVSPKGNAEVSDDDFG